MADKQKKITVTTSANYKRSFVLPEGAFIQHINEYVLVYPSSWRSDTPVFQVQLATDDMWFVEEVSADEELVEKIKKLDKAGMDMLRNMMDSADLLK